MKKGQMQFHLTLFHRVILSNEEEVFRPAPT